MRVALGQIDTTDKRGVLEKVEFLVRKNSADIFVFPELLTTGYKEVAENAEDINGESLRFLRELSRETGKALVFSMALRRDDGIYNTAFFIFGDRMFYYDKAHLFKPLGEEEIFKPGRSLKLFETEIGGNSFKFSLQICYDLRFPETFRKLALNGVKIIFIPAQWPLTRIGIWNSMLVSRAAENGIFIVGCNRVGEEKGIVYGGNSSVISPAGEVLVRLGEREGFAVVDVDLKEVERVRERINVLADVVDLDIE
jgi:predicted amidohydrolase